MKSFKSSKGQRKRGLSLSISNNCSFLPKNQYSHSKPIKYQSFSCQTPINIIPRPTISLQRPPVIIYRYRKSQWQELQEKNKKKREQVKHIKFQLQNLNIQLEQWKNRETKKEYFSNRSQSDRLTKRQENRVLTSNNIVRILELNQNFHPCPKQAQVKTNYIKRNNETSIKIIKVNECVEGKRELKNIQNQQNYNFKQQGIGQRKIPNRMKNLQIDLNSLEQIEKRLNKLIDFTTST